MKYGQSAQGKLRVTANEGIVGAAIAAQQPVRVPDVTLDPRYIMVNPETRSELAIPMIHKGRVVGVLDLESPQVNYFTEDHVQTLMILAAHLAVSLENARLYEQLARDEARMERELTAAQRLQTALLRPVPSIDFGLDITARILSAREVCGDLYDFLSYGTQQLGIALGDVSGKGSAAALYGAVATGILRSLSPHKLQPAELLRQLNQLVCDRRVEGRYMTICFATWQKARRKLRVANAGQTQPLLWKDGHVEQINLSGFPIGIFDDATYDEWSVSLNSGDILLFYSDGLTEASNREGKFFGTDRIKELSGRQCALDFQRTGRPHARGSAGIYARRSHHGRSHAGGDESQVSAASLTFARFSFCRTVDPGELYSRVFLSRIAPVLRRRFRCGRRRTSRNARVSLQPREHRAGLSPHGFRIRLAPAHDLLRGESQFKSWASCACLPRLAADSTLFPAGNSTACGASACREIASFFPAWANRAKKFAKRLRARILLFNVESAAELDLLASEASRLRVRAAASIRVNPDVEAGGHPHISTGHHRHKFGIDWETARGLYLQHRDSRWIDWQGISAHIGSQILTLRPYRRALARLAGFVRDLAARGHRAALSRLRRRARHPLHVGGAAGKSRICRGTCARRSSARMPSADRAGAIAGWLRRRVC